MSMTIAQLWAKKAEGKKISMITTYDATFASLVDAAGIDMSPINPVRHASPGYEYESANIWASSKFKHVDYKEHKRGDIIIYCNETGTVIHSAIYLGDDNVILYWSDHARS